MSKLKHALACAKRGFDVFPIVPDDKTPLIKNWINLASPDEAQIRAWWRDEPSANIGICTNNLLVVDIDQRDNGFENFAALSLVDAFPETLRARTRSDGRHIVYRMPPHTFVSNSTGRLAPGIDVRGYHGYIVADGSTVGDGFYEWRNELKPALAPQWLIDRCKAPRKKTAAAGAVLVPEDQDAIDLAWHWLKTLAPCAEQGKRDDTAYIVACRLYEHGVVESTCVELLMEWNLECCQPPLDLSDMQRIAASASTGMENPKGLKHPLNASGFLPATIDESAAPPAPPEKQPGRFTLLRADQAAREALAHPGDPLIKGLMNRLTMATLIGAPGSGKTFMALDWAYHVAKGLPWAGRAVRQGAAVYLAAEAGHMIKTRVAALELHYGALGDLPLFIIPHPADFAHGAEDAMEVVRMLLELEQSCGHKIELFVVDTLSRTLSGGDENGPKDMGAFVKAVDFIREEVRTHTLVVHHFGKDEGRGGRGHTILKGATDTEMQISNKVLRFTKQRDMAEGEPISFKLKPIRIGVDPEGEPVTSCVVHVLGKDEVADVADLTRTQMEILESLNEEMADRPDMVFTAQFVVKLIKGEVSKPSDATFSESCARSEKEVARRDLQCLQHLGWIRKVGANQYVMRQRNDATTRNNAQH